MSTTYQKIPGLFRFDAESRKGECIMVKIKSRDLRS